MKDAFFLQTQNGFVSFAGQFAKRKSWLNIGNVQRNTINRMKTNFRQQQNSHSVFEVFAGNIQKLFVNPVEVPCPNIRSYLSQNFAAFLFNQLRITMAAMGIVIQFGNFSFYPIRFGIGFTDNRFQASGYFQQRIIFFFSCVHA